MRKVRDLKTQIRYYSLKNNKSKVNQLKIQVITIINEVKKSMSARHSIPKKDIRYKVL